jgi:hypothetical protein
LRNQAFEVRFEKWDFARLQGRQLGTVVVGTTHGVTDLRETSRGRQTDVPRPNY